MVLSFPCLNLTFLLCSPIDLIFQFATICVQEDIGEIFKKADKDNSGTLTVKEMQEVVDDILERYPQIELYLKSRQMKSIVDLMKDANEDVKKESIELNIEEFRTALSDVDGQMKNLPATAQVQLHSWIYLK